MHHSISKSLIVLSANEYLEDWKAKLENAYSFMLKYSKITVCRANAFQPFWVLNGTKSNYLIKPPGYLP